MKTAWMGLATAFLLAVLPLAAQDSAFIAGPGTTGASMNGAPLLPGTAILPGETVTTAPGGTVVLAPTQGSGLIQLGANASAVVGTGSQSTLQVNLGSAVITGSLSVATPQATFLPTSGGSSQYVVNASASQSSMAVVQGDVNTASNTGTSGTTSSSQSVGAGLAVQVSDSGQINAAQFNTVQAPSAAVTKTDTASSSGGNGGGLI